eukprot:2182019-Prorocentrum_lima.AAC.1
MATGARDPGSTSTRLRAMDPPNIVETEAAAVLQHSVQAMTGKAMKGKGGLESDADTGDSMVPTKR